MVKKIWLQMIFGEIFWGEVMIDALKTEGDAGKRKIIIHFSRCQIGKATSGYYKWKINIPMCNWIICQIYLFNTIIILNIHFVFCLIQNILPLFAVEFHKGDNVMLKL